MHNPTTKFLVTLPKAVADKYEIQAGDEVEGVDAGDEIRVVPPKTLPRMLSTQERLRLFDDGTSRQRAREADAHMNAVVDAAERGWTREEIYDRDCAR